MSADHLVLAGGGHSHALILLRWAMRPHLRPKGLITLVNRKPNTLYSGMVPGLISGAYNLNEVLIDLYLLADRAGVCLVVDEIVGLNINEKLLLLNERPSIPFTRLSLDVGSETDNSQLIPGIETNQQSITIRPLEAALKWISNQDRKELLANPEPLNIVGSGYSALEVALALRQRWPRRPLRLVVNDGDPSCEFREALSLACIETSIRGDLVSGASLFCTGVKSPDWLRESGLNVDKKGRVFTSSAFILRGMLLNK